MTCKMLLFDYRNNEKYYFERFKNNNFEIKFIESSLNDETINNIPENYFEETNVISVFITSHITREIIEKFKNLRVISTRSSRYGHIDLKACVDNNIALVNVPLYENKSTECILSETFKGIMSIYCGDKSYRIV